VTVLIASPDLLDGGLFFFTRFPFSSSSPVVRFWREVYNLRVRSKHGKEASYLADACFAEPNDGPRSDPSPRQILARCLVIQASWSEHETAFRLVPHLDGVPKDKSQPHWRLPTVAFNLEGQDVTA
jgi:hypothetical protein